MSNLLQRFLTALIAGSAAVYAIAVSHYGLMLFCFVVSMAGLWEFLVLSVPTKRYRFWIMGIGGAIWAFLLVTSLMGMPEKSVFVWLGLALILPLLGLVVLFEAAEKNPLYHLGVMILGLLYTYFPFLLFYKMGFAGGEYDYRIPLGILILTWAVDVGAYFAGRFLGRKPLFPRISPKKTWAGSIGGAVLGIGIAILFDFVPFASEGLFFSWIVVGAVIAVLNQTGDLIESMIKRSVAIKDSGSILPGHGGMLDRFDGPYITIPVLFFLFELIHSL